MIRLYRERWDKKIGGVCGGFGQFFQIDPGIIRLILLFLFCVTFILPPLIAYLVCWLIIPIGPPTYIQPKYKRLYKSKRSSVFSGLCAGIAGYLNLDPSLVRILYVTLTIFTGFFPGLLTYWIGSVIIPTSP